MTLIRFIFYHLLFSFFLCLLCELLSTYLCSLRIPRKHADLFSGLAQLKKSQKLLMIFENKNRSFFFVAILSSQLQLFSTIKSFLSRSFLCRYDKGYCISLWYFNLNKNSSLSLMKKCFVEWRSITVAVCDKSIVYVTGGDLNARKVKLCSREQKGSFIFYV